MGTIISLISVMPFQLVPQLVLAVLALSMLLYTEPATAKTCETNAECVGYEKCGPFGECFNKLHTMARQGEICTGTETSENGFYCEAPKPHCFLIYRGSTEASA